ncbi:MAG: right-handed parallel beta-helix repeat-containing protein [Phycisphaerales bacterium]|nr:MAG: right-handed parallel beta-helix repeat-containing protein [Phycisphaerales bacterium]
MKKAVLFSYAVLSVVGALSQAETRLVPGEYTTIQRAIRDCNDGDVVIVEPGKYYETINYSGKNITIRSTDPNDPAVVASTVIDGDGDGTVVTFENGESPSAVLTGFTIRGGFGTLTTDVEPSVTLFMGAGIYCFLASPTITGNVISDNHGPTRMEGDTPDWQVSYGVAIGGVTVGGVAAGPVISRNTITHNTGYAGAGIFLIGDVTIRDNLIYENSALVGGGVILAGGRLINNTIVANDASFAGGAQQAGNVYILYSPEFGQMSVVNNIICNATSGGGIYWPSGYQEGWIRFNDVWGNVPGNYGGVNQEGTALVWDGPLDATGTLGNISVNPMFVNPADDDYHLQTGSPCIAAGDPSYVPPIGVKDIDGEPRVYAQAIDIGADEYVGYIGPVPNAGRDQHIVEPQLVTLDGSDSFFYDPCGVMVFQWTQVAGPPVELSDPAAVQPTFMAEVEGEYRFELVVADDLNTSGPDEVLILFGPNRKPVADAGPDRVCGAPDRVALDGTGSFDPDPDVLIYTWRQLEGPEVVLQNGDTATPFFDCTEEGLYVFELVVSDGIVDSEPSLVKVTTVVVTRNQEPLNIEPDTDGYCHYADVSGTKLVYAVGLGNDYTWDIRCKDLETGDGDLFTGGGIDTQPKIDGDVVVWSGGPLFPSGQGRENTSVFARNIATGKQVVLRQYSNTESYSHPAVSGNKVVWLQHIEIDRANELSWNNTPYDICGADITDLDNPVYFNVAYNAGFRDPYPVQTYDRDFDSVVDVSGDIVVWEGNGDIFGADISNVHDTKVFTICDHPARQYDPAISGNLVVWTDERNDEGDIFGADVRDPETIEELAIVRAPGAQLQPDVDGCMVVYIEGSAYGGQIKATYLTRYGVLDAGSVPSTGVGPAIDSDTVVWQSSTSFGGAMAATLGFAYSGADGPIENLTSGKYYDYVQHAIHAAEPGDVIVVGAGKYEESIRFRGKNLTVRSLDPNDPPVVTATVIDGGSDAVIFSGGVDANCVLAGLTITGASRGVHCSGSSPTIMNCRIADNRGAGVKLANESNPTIDNCRIVANRGAGIDMRARRVGRLSYYNYATVTNSIIAANRQQGVFGSKPAISCCTIVQNLGQGISSVAPSVTNSIIYYNGGAQIESYSAAVTYSAVQGGWPGLGNTDADPCFVDVGHWADRSDPNIWVDPENPNAIWVDGDYHLSSQGWRWNALRRVWTWDDATSGCIDAGNPGTSIDEELASVPGDLGNEWGQNVRVNMGAFGGAAQASMAPPGWALLADLDNDGHVDLHDYALQTGMWAGSADHPGDLDRNGRVDLGDVALISDKWLAEAMRGE